MKQIEFINVDGERRKEWQHKSPKNRKSLTSAAAAAVAVDVRRRACVMDAECCADADSMRKRVMRLAQQTAPRGWPAPSSAILPPSLPVPHAALATEQQRDVCTERVRMAAMAREARAVAAAALAERAAALTTANPSLPPPLGSWARK